VDPHAHVDFCAKALSNALVDELDAFENPERRPNGANGIIFMGHRVAEIGHDAVPKELRNMSFVAADRVAADPLVTGQQVTQILRIEALRKLCRADDVAKQDRELTPLILR
jgi:hypothetical protein